MHCRDAVRVTAEHFTELTAASGTPKLRNALAFVGIFPSPAIGNRTEMVPLFFVEHHCIAHY